MGLETDLEIRAWINKDFSAYVVSSRTSSDGTPEIGVRDPKITVEELLNKHDPPPLLNEIKESDWTWIHLPAVNKEWIKALFEILVFEGVIQVDPFSSTGLGGVPDQSFGEKSFSGTEGVAVRKKPSANAEGSSREDLFSLAVPFFDAESSDYLRPQGFERHRLRNLQRAYKVSGLLEPRSLDQCFYTTLGDTTKLDADQVVFRHYTNYRQKSMYKENSPHFDPRFPELQPRILMVCPMRIWKIDKIVITAFSENWTERPYDLSSHIYESIRYANPFGATDLLLIILQVVITLIDEPYNAGLNESLATIFETETAYQAEQQLTLYQNFRAQLTTSAKPPQTSLWEGIMRDQLRWLIGPSRARSGGRKLAGDQSEEAHDKMRIISDEVECFRIVMDIIDELKMISSVIDDQEEVIQYLKKLGELKQISIDSSQNLQLDQMIYTLRRWQKSLSGVNTRAQMVEKALNHLVDIKINQANLELTQAADARAKQAETQSKLLFIFTAVTVIFTPISFASGFLAIPSRDYPRDRSGVLWSKTQIGLGLGFSELVTFILILWVWVGLVIHSHYNKPVVPTLQAPESVEDARRRWEETRRRPPSPKSSGAIV